MKIKKKYCKFIIFNKFKNYSLFSSSLDKSVIEFKGNKDLKLLY